MQRESTLCWRQIDVPLWELGIREMHVRVGAESERDPEGFHNSNVRDAFAGISGSSELAGI